MIKLYRRFRQYRCWIIGGKDEELCQFFVQYDRFRYGACSDCKHNPYKEEE